MTKDSGIAESALPAAAKPEAAGHHPPASWNNEDVEILAFPPTGHGTSIHFGRNVDGTTPEMMGSVLRRKKVVSMPGVGTEGNYFFGGDKTIHQVVLAPPSSSPEPKWSLNSGAGLMSGVVKRKQVSLDLLEPDELSSVPQSGEVEALLSATAKADEPTHAEAIANLKLFRPLRFAPRTYPKNTEGHDGHKNGKASGAAVDKETADTLAHYTRANADLRLQLSSFANKIIEEQDELGASRQSNNSIHAFLGHIEKTQTHLETQEEILQKTLKTIQTSFNDSAGVEDDGIIRATRVDKIKAFALFCIMLAVTIIVVAWKTHADEESFIHGPVGLACVTDCPGNVTTRDFFYGHNHFEDGEVIRFDMHLDANSMANENGAEVTVEIYGVETGTVKRTSVFGSPKGDGRIHIEKEIDVDFDHPDEAHIVNVYGSEDIPMSFTLMAHVQTPLSNKSELVAALIMILVYVFIVFEIIHRTLVALFGSMIILTFYFAMHGGTTEELGQIMLHMSWSTFGLLFGMMLLVGELSHTGVFEWSAVRLLVASKGSFVRLLCLLGMLTAVASAFLDNVTTVLLVVPVTIDMCNILDVDPRPYLIAEVLMSNIGGTATLIGDPPNIMIGSSFDEIGFVDFIIHLTPCIFGFTVPVTLAIICWIYRPYLTTSKMRVLDISKLKQTYPIYDQPRLMLAGTSTLFVILMFFLHSAHHKDTAWIALVGGFVTIAFTNPHNIQEALRSHIEWDTLLFFAGLFVLVETCAAMGLLRLIGNGLANYIESQPVDSQLTIAITLILWVSAITSAFLDNIPYTATMIPIIKILSDKLPDTLPIVTLAWALSLGACLGGNGTIVGASANIVTAGLASNRGFEISFVNFLYPGMVCMFASVAISNIYMLIRYVWAQ